MLSLRFSHVAAARGGVKNNAQAIKFGIQDRPQRKVDPESFEGLGKASRALVRQTEERYGEMTEDRDWTF